MICRTPRCRPSGVPLQGNHGAQSSPKVGVRAESQVDVGELGLPVASALQMTHRCESLAHGEEIVLLPQSVHAAQAVEGTGQQMVPGLGVVEIGAQTLSRELGRLLERGVVAEVLVLQHLGLQGEHRSQRSDGTAGLQHADELEVLECTSVLAVEDLLEALMERVDLTFVTLEGCGAWRTPQDGAAKRAAARTRQTRGALILTESISVRCPVLFRCGVSLDLRIRGRVEGGASSRQPLLQSLCCRSALGREPGR